MINTRVRAIKQEAAESRPSRDRDKSPSQSTSLLQLVVTVLHGCSGIMWEVDRVMFKSFA